jgi:ATP-binding cassette subfamily E protein 1
MVNFLVRVAVIDEDKCKPKECERLCYRFCPMVRTKVYAIRFEEGKEKPTIVEPLCTGCGICVKKCPFEAITIVNLPEELEEECSHRYGENAFKLYRLPIPLPSKVTGLIGKNGTGKTTALRILAGEIKPNLGRFDSELDWDEIIRHFRGSPLQEYFNRLKDGKIRVVHKPQYVDKIPQLVKDKVLSVLARVDERGKMDWLIETLELKEVLDRSTQVLSGGECQRLAVAVAVCREADVYIFDEPSSYLDVKQRLNVAKVIRSLALEGKTVIVAEHDIAMLDYLSDQVCIIYGKPGVYGIVSHPHGVRTGINFYLEGYLADDNVRFRSEPIRFHVKPPTSTWFSTEPLFSWSRLKKSYGEFELEVEEGTINKGEVIGVLGPNGIGKTTFIRMLSGLEKPDEGEVYLPNMESLSYKPQYISMKYEGTVEELLKKIAGEDFETDYYKTEILTPLGLEKLLDRRVDELSGGETQKVAIASCLSKKSQLYLLDEPSAFLDVEERLAVARIIRRKVESLGAAAIVVEHDVSVQDFIADKLMPFTGKPGKHGYAFKPLNLRDGMNSFLKDLGVTFRRDPLTGRPRVNKEGSRMDRYQKEIGEYYYISQ